MLSLSHYHSHRLTHTHTCTHAHKQTRTHTPLPGEGRSTLFVSLSISHLLQSTLGSDSYGCHSDSLGIITRYYGMSSVLSCRIRTWCLHSHGHTGTQARDGSDAQHSVSGSTCSRLVLTLTHDNMMCTAAEEGRWLSRRHTRSAPQLSEGLTRDR